MYMIQNTLTRNFVCLLKTLMSKLIKSKHVIGNIYGEINIAALCPHLHKHAFNFSLLISWHHHQQASHINLSTIIRPLRNWIIKWITHKNNNSYFITNPSWVWFHRINVNTLNSPPWCWFYRYQSSKTSCFMLLA